MSDTPEMVSSMTWDYTLTTFVIYFPGIKQRNLTHSVSNLTWFMVIKLAVSYQIPAWLYHLSGLHNWGERLFGLCKSYAKWFWPEREIVCGKSRLKSRSDFKKVKKILWMTAVRGKFLREQTGVHAKRNVRWMILRLRPDLNCGGLICELWTRSNLSLWLIRYLIAKWHWVTGKRE